MNNFNFLNNLTVLFNNKEVQNKNNTVMYWILEKLFFNNLKLRRSFYEKR